MLLNYRSELAQIWRQDTDTIHDHKYKASAVCNMGCNGRVVWGAYFQMVFRTDLAHFLCLQFITHFLFGPDFTVQTSPVLWYSLHKCQQKLVFSLFFDVQKDLEPRAITHGG